MSSNVDSSPAPDRAANVDGDEISHFESLAARWWDLRGEMGTLHAVNPVRLRYLEARAGALRGQRVLDVGCGGGILTEALARKGASVLGIDLAKASVDVAVAHAAEQKVPADYRLIAAEDLAQQEPESFDLVCCMEMLEHVPDPAQTVAACAALTKRGGNVVFSTINRNAKSWALMILAAEYTLRLIPRGTHEYARFIRPSELDRWSRRAGLEPADVTGLRYNPLLRSASLNTRDIDVNYFLHCRKPA